MAAAAAALARLVAINTRSCKLATHSSTQGTREMAQDAHLLLLLNVFSKHVQDAGGCRRNCFSFWRGLRGQSSVQLSAQSDRYLHCSNQCLHCNAFNCLHVDRSSGFSRGVRRPTPHSRRGACPGLSTNWKHVRKNISCIS